MTKETFKITISRLLDTVTKDLLGTGADADNFRRRYPDLARVTEHIYPFLLTLGELKDVPELKEFLSTKLEVTSFVNTDEDNDLERVEVRKI
jgi:hypothetical protein